LDADIDALDAASDADLRGPVTIGVYDSSSAPIHGVPIVFQNGDDSLVKMTATDAQGMASANMLAGGSVTAIELGADLYTFEGVKPGDHLQLGPSIAPPPPFAASFLLPAYAGNVYDYVVVTRCGSGSATTATRVATMDLSCSPVDVYVAARDTSTDHFTLAAFYRPGVTVGSGDTIDLTAQTYQPLETVQLTVDHVPSFVNSGDVVAILSGPGFAFEQRAATITLTTTGNTSQATAAVPLPALSGVALEVVAQLRTTPTVGSPEVEELRQMVAFSGDVTMDAGPLLIPWITGFPAFQVATSSTTWSDSGGTADYTHVVLHGIRGSFSYTWNVAGPYQPGKLALPVLPVPFDANNPEPGDTIAPDRFYIAKLPGGWDATRLGVFDLVAAQPADFSPGQTAVASAPGTAVLTRRRR
jgi:hypothetical protein